MLTSGHTSEGKLMTEKELRPVIFNRPGDKNDLKDFGPNPVPYEGELVVGITEEIEEAPKENPAEVETVEIEEVITLAPGVANVNLKKPLKTENG